jgi:molybdate transport system permease protein
MINPLNAIKLSLIVSTCSTLLSAPLAIGFGWLMAKKNFKLKFMVSSLLFVPLVLPPVLIGFLLLSIFSRNHFLGLALEQVGISIPFTILGAIIASMVVGFPIYVMLTRNSFENIDPQLEEMASILGYSPKKVFFKFTLPLAFPGILAGSIIAFARSIGEFGATILIAGNMEGKTRTISLALYSLFDLPDSEKESFLLIIVSLIISILSLCLFEFFNRWHKKRMGRQ